MGLPVEIDPLLLASKTSAYSVSKSLRFRSSASAYLSRAFGTPTSATTWTLSWWAKLGAVQTNGGSFFGSYTSSASNFAVRYNTPGAYGGTGCNIEIYNNGSVMDLMTAGIFRDPSAWYHFCITFDSTQATASNRLKFYINGVQATFATFTTYPNQNTSVVWNTNGTTCLIGALNNPLTSYYDGYMAEVNFVDGQALAATYFGTYDTNGVWQPIKYSGTYGTNGFYLPFTNTTSTATLGNDFSGNSNNWTTNNISLTAGSTYDSMNDSPTVSSATVANYATLNPIGVPYNTGTATGGNLNWTGASTADKGMAATISMSSGKWYWECTVTATGAGSNSYVGIVKTAGTADSNANRVYYRGDGATVKYGTATTGLATYTTGDVIGIAYDYSAQTLAFYKNNTLVTTVTSINLEPYLPWVGSYTTTESWAFNAGQRPFSYSAPTGFNALNTYNLPAPTIANGAQYMAATTYTGTGATLSVSNAVNGVGLQPDFVWFKSRSGAYNHLEVDSVRGLNKYLYPNLTDAEGTFQVLDSVNSSGFVVNSSIGTPANNSGTTYVAWQWKASGSTVTNTNGSITSTVSANTTAGFSVVTYTGTGANATVGHGLGAVPAMYIIKNRTGSSYWTVYHQSLGNNILRLNTTDAAIANSAYFSSYPTSTLIYNSTSGDVNGSGSTYVAYCWAAVPGYSAFGSYTGNGSTDGPFIYTGFRPRFIIAKDATNIDSASWMMQDSSRDTYNVGYKSLYANDPSVESVSSNDNVDILSNGFKIRNASSAWNNFGQTFIYAAFAENPFKNSRAR